MPVRQRAISSPLAGRDTMRSMVEGGRAKCRPHALRVRCRPPSTAVPAIPLAVPGRTAIQLRERMTQLPPRRAATMAMDMNRPMSSPSPAMVIVTQ